MRCTLLALCLSVSAFTASAADFSVGAPNRDAYDVQVPDPALPCSHRLTGQINAGDGDRVVTALRASVRGWRDQNIYGQSVLCLDSGGGSLVEALKIADALRTGTIGTRIEAGARCESACALIFMAGSFFAHESGRYKWRVLHPTGKLGFHAPDLQLSEGQYSAEAVSRSYALALETIAVTLTNLMQNRDFEDGEHLKPSLLAAMLRTPPDQMMYIDTVDEVGRWDITVGPLQTSGLYAAEADFRRHCANKLRWSADESAIGGDDYSSTWFATWAKRGHADNLQIMYNDMTGEACEYWLPNGSAEQKAAELDRIQPDSGQMIRFIDARIQLAALPY